MWCPYGECPVTISLECKPTGCKMLYNVYFKSVCLFQMHCPKDYIYILSCLQYFLGKCESYDLCWLLQMSLLLRWFFPYPFCCHKQQVNYTLMQITQRSVLRFIRLWVQVPPRNKTRWLCDLKITKISLRHQSVWHLVQPLSTGPSRPKHSVSNYI